MANIKYTVEEKRMASKFKTPEEFETEYTKEYGIKYTPLALAMRARNLWYGRKKGAVAVAHADAIAKDAVHKLTIPVTIKSKAPAGAAGKPADSLPDVGETLSKCLANLVEINYKFDDMLKLQREYNAMQKEQLEFFKGLKK